MGYTYGIHWTDEIIEKNLLEVLRALNIDYFPSHGDIKKYYGNNALSCAISKKGGTVYWAERLGVPLKTSDTTMGNKFEMIAIDDIFKNTGLVGIKMSSRYPYDLYVNGSIKIDVKVSHLYITNHGENNTFNLEKRYPTCDVFILYCLDSKEKCTKTLVIPSCLITGLKQLGVGKKSKWDQFKDRWDILLEYASFYSEIIEEHHFN